MAKDSVSGKTSIFTFSDEVISVETTGNISYYRNDEKHSVTDILDTAGKVKYTIEYDGYSVIANPTGCIMRRQGIMMLRLAGL